MFAISIILFFGKHSAIQNLPLFSLSLKSAITQSKNVTHIKKPSCKKIESEISGIFGWVWHVLDGLGMFWLVLVGFGWFWVVLVVCKLYN